MLFLGITIPSIITYILQLNEKKIIKSIWDFHPNDAD